MSAFDPADEKTDGALGPPSKVVTLSQIRDRTLAMDFSPNGEFLACGGEDRRVRIFDETGRLTTIVGGHAAPILALAFSPEGGRIVSAGAHLLVTDGPIITPLEESPPFPAEGPPKDRLKFPIMGQGRIWSRGRFVSFHDVHTGEFLGGGGGGGDAVPHILSVAFSENGTTLATFDGKLCLQTLQTPWGRTANSPRVLPDSNDYARALAYVKTLGGDSLRIVSRGHWIKLLEIAQKKDPVGSKVGELDPRTARTACAMRLDGKRFAVGFQDGAIAEWDFDKGTLIRKFDKPSTGTLPVEFLAYGPDGSRLISGDESGVVRLYDAASGRLLQTRNGPARPVRAAVFLPSKIKLASGGFHLRTDPKLPQAERDTAEPIVVWEMGRD